jgi:hypothetical protein
MRGGPGSIRDCRPGGWLMPKVFKFRKYAPTQDDYVTSTRMATKKKIKQLGAEIVPGTEIKIDGQFVNDGWTEKNFRPSEKKDKA